MNCFIDAMHYFRQGGVVMFFLLAISLWVWGLIAERIYFFFKNSGRAMRPEFAVSMISGSMPDSPGGAMEVCAALAVHFGRYRCGNPALDSRILEEHWLRQKKRIHQGLSLVAALAAAAPLLGLFGTVLGIIDTFGVISVFGAGNAKALAGGISKALISTHCGLLVGIPALLMYVLLQQQARLLEARLKETRIVLKRNFTA